MFNYLKLPSLLLLSMLALTGCAEMNSDFILVPPTGYLQLIDQTDHPILCFSHR